MARLFGMQPAAPSHCRVLELGAADGANLLPMAEQWPKSEFIGIDASRVQVAAGQKAIEAVALKNVELRVQDILEFPSSAGKFDYIIAHGVYSWVPDAVREKILNICETHLTEQGVAYISYNALPGWSIRRSLRDMILFHTKAFADPVMKVQQARALIAFLAESVPTENNGYGMLLKAELESMNRHVDSYLRHEILEEENTPFYFHQFVGQASSHGLQYLGEPSISQMFAGNFPEKVSATLEKLSGQIIAQEQYMDFLRNRVFRQTLLCRSSVPLRRKVAKEEVTQFAFQSLFKQPAEPIDLSPGITGKFETPNNLQLNSNDPFLKAALQTLADSNGARALSYAEILDVARTSSRPYIAEGIVDRNALDEATLQQNLFSLLIKGFVELLAEPVNMARHLPEKPELSALVRYQAVNARTITNRVHQPVPADLLARNIIELCDGTRTQEDILTVLVTRAQQGGLQVNEGARRVVDEDKLRQVFQPRLEAALNILLKGGFFAP